MMRRAALALALLAAAAGCRRGTGPASAGGGAGGFQSTVTCRPRELRAPLDARVRFRLEAGSWEELVARARPACTWNDLDMLWVAEEPGRPVRFVVERAWIYRPADGPPKWVLAGFDSGGGSPPIRERFGSWPRAEIAVGAPPAGGDGCIGDYARRLASDARFGTVYQLGWQGEISGGTNLFSPNRAVFLLRDPQLRWRVIGQGIEEGVGKAGYPVCWRCGAEYRVRWTGDPSDPAAVEITVTHSLCEVGEEQSGAPTLATHRDGVLVRRPEFGVKWTGREHVRAEPGDTLEAIASRLAWWDSCSIRREAPGRREAAARWAGTLRELNPGVGAGELPAGARLFVR